MRRQPVAFFLGDAAFMADPKFRALGRRLTDPDAFNSAVGAYFIALAGARRNGLPCIDVAAETASSYIDDLVAVGLLTAQGFPDKAFREWAPARPKRPSESPVPSVSDVSSVSNTSERAGDVASTPLPSTPIPSTGGAGGWPNLDDEAIASLEQRTGQPWSQAGDKQLLEYDRLIGSHGLARVCEAFDAIRRDKPMTARQLVWSAVKVLEPFPDTKEAAVDLKPVRRGPSASVITAAHNNGFHEANPDDRCSYCREGAA